MGKHSKILEIICFPGSIFSVCEQHGDLRAIPRITCPRKPSFKSKWPKSQPTARVATGPPGRAPPGQAPRCPRHGCPGGRPQRRGGGGRRGAGGCRGPRSAPPHRSSLAPGRESGVCPRRAAMQAPTGREGSRPPPNPRCAGSEAQAGG